MSDEDEVGGRESMAEGPATCWVAGSMVIMTLHEDARALTLGAAVI